MPPAIDENEHVKRQARCGDTMGLVLSLRALSGRSLRRRSL